MRTSVFGAGAVLAALSAGLLGATPGSGAIGLPTTQQAIHPPVREAVYGGVDFGATGSAKDDRPVSVRWRLVDDVGNCCEHYVTTTSGGWLLDFGGSYVNVSKDRGKTWQQVRPLTPLVAGEGGVVAGLDGDVLGVAWDANAADQLQSFKYDARSRQWLYTQMPVHQPFYDRPWIGVVPGPVTILGTTYPYVSFIKGGHPTKELWFYSTDGLNYLAVTAKTAQQLAAPEPVPGRLRTVAHPALDWVQPNTNSRMAALGRGGVLAAPDRFDGRYALLDGKTFSWSSVVLPDGKEPTGRFQVDSAGRIHNVITDADRAGFVYRMSGDGGAHWRSVHVVLPPKLTVQGLEDAFGIPGLQQWDFRANRAAGVAAVAIRAYDAKSKTDRDLVYKLDITGSAPRLARLLRVGLGDVNSGEGTVGGAVRVDFGSLAIFADGRVALTFLDSKSTWEHPLVAGARGNSPGLAVEE
jgi:hypothetical protein